MFSVFIKSIFQGIGLVLGIIICIMLMQASASILSKYGLIDNFEKKKERLEQEYKDAEKGLSDL